MSIEERLTEKLRSSVRITPKRKEDLDVKAYFALREREAEKIILVSSFAYEFFENEATLEEIERFNLDLIDKKTLMLIVVQALKAYIDSEQHETAKAQALHELYLKVKSPLSLEIPFPNGDGFLDYLEGKKPRAEILEARTTGKVCIFCGSHEVKSYGHTWFCSSCGKQFRKEKYMKKRET